MKKLYELGEITGLRKAEVNRIAKCGLLGLMAVGLAALVGCFKAQKADKPAAVQSQNAETLQDIADSVNASTPTAKPQGKCGPYPGYPCGTRYYTVSPADARRLA